MVPFVPMEVPSLWCVPCIDGGFPSIEAYQVQPLWCSRLLRFRVILFYRLRLICGHYCSRKIEAISFICIENTKYWLIDVTWIDCMTIYARGINSAHMRCSLFHGLATGRRHCRCWLPTAFASSHVTSEARTAPLTSAHGVEAVPLLDDRLPRMIRRTRTSSTWTHVIVCALV
jgi:hypothetical protein